MTSSQPSERVRQLLRAGAELVLQNQALWVEELNRHRWASPIMQTVAADPVLVAAADRATRVTMTQWLAANVRDPGAPVVPHLDPEMLTIARDLVRRGLGESTVDAYRLGQAAVLPLWMKVAFALTSDPVELQELLEVSAQSITEFAEAALNAVNEQVRSERDELVRSNHPERREMIALLLEGAPVPTERAEARLGYKLAQTHTAAVVWNSEPESQLSELERALDALVRRVGARSPLTIVPGGATIWAWLPVDAKPDLEQLARDLNPLPGARIALGPSLHGTEGFRRSHMAAVTTQRMLAGLRSAQRVAAFEDVQLVALATTNAEAATDFVRSTLGDLATADAELRETVLAYVRERGSLVRTAEKLFVHRNTVIRRLERADELLPQGLEHNPVHVAVALEILLWHGSLTGSVPDGIA